MQIRQQLPKIQFQAISQKLIKLELRRQNTFRAIYQHQALHLQIIKSLKLSRHALSLSHIYPKTHQKDNNLFKPFVISEIILCPYGVNGIYKVWPIIPYKCRWHYETIILSPLG